jgi:hypothetical protein
MFINARTEWPRDEGDPLTGSVSPAGIHITEEGDLF